MSRYQSMRVVAVRVRVYVGGREYVDKSEGANMRG